MPLFLFLIKFQRTFTAQKKYRITSILSKAPTRFELVIEVLQTFALPLGYGAIYFLSNILYSNNKKIITKYLFSVNIFYLSESKFLFIRLQN